MDRPILFSGPMVRALLDGRKTQTRRVLIPQPYPLAGRPGYWNASGAIGGRIVISDQELARLHRYTVGDRLWVRETWKPHSMFAHLAPRDVPRTNVFFRADERYAPSNTPWRPGIHMPRWVSRLTLIVTEVRVQRLQEIEPIDCYAEGCFRPDPKRSLGSVVTARDNARGEYRRIWNGLNAKRGYAWEANPWVVAVTFTVESRNIDALDASEAA